MYLRPVIFVLCTVLTLIAAGCNGAQELDEVAYILSVGLDAAPNNQLAITYRIAIPTTISGVEPSQGSSKKSSVVVTVIAPTMTDGRNLLNSIISRSPKVFHIKTIVIGEELARKGLSDLVSSVMRFRDYRETIILAIARGSAKDLIVANQPELDVLPSRWVESMFQSYYESSYYLRADLHQFYKRLKNETGAPYAVVMGINPLSGKGQAENRPLGEDKGRAYIASQIPRYNGNPVEVCGTAVFKGDKLVGFLDSKQTRALSILLGDWKRGFMSVEDPLLPTKPVNVNIHLSGKPAITVDISSAIPAITIKLSLEGEFTAISSGINYESEDYKVLLEHQVSNTIFEQILDMLSVTQGLGTDVVNFGYYIRPLFNTIQALEAYNWNSKYPEASITLEVETHLRRSGLMRKTMPIRED